MLRTWYIAHFEISAQSSLVNNYYRRAFSVTVQFLKDKVLALMQKMNKDKHKSQLPIVGSHAIEFVVSRDKERGGTKIT